jgi:hypothetical protein
MKNCSSIYSSILQGFLLLIIQPILISVFIPLINGCKKKQSLKVTLKLTTDYITVISPTSANCIGNAFSREFGRGDIRDIICSDIITESAIDTWDNLLGACLRNPWLL